MVPMGLSRAGVLLCLMLLLPACGRQKTAGAPGNGGAPRGVSWGEDVWPILLIRCQVCHTVGEGAQAVPDMPMSDPSTLYDRWVRVFSQCNPNLFRVLPGESGQSFVYDKISREAPLCGQRMPLIGPMLEPSEQQTIRDWIDQGALHN